MAQLRTPDGRFANADQIEAFNKAIAEGATEAEAMASTFGKAKRASDKATEAKEKETKASKGFVDSLRARVAGGALAVGAMALRQGLVTSNTTDASFGTGALNFVEGLYSGATGSNLNQRQAIGDAGSQTFSFFADAMRSGAEVSNAQIDEMQKFFRDREDRLIPLKERVGGNVERDQLATSVEARAKVIEDLLVNIRDSLRGMGGGGN